MKVEQIYNIVNTITGEILGSTELLNEDLSNIVDIGNQIFNINAKDNYVRALLDQVGRMVFVNRVYRGGAPKVVRDAWEFGAVLMKIQADIPVATENESWELQDGASYDPNIFYQPKVSAKFFNNKVTFEVPMSFTDIQVKESFQNAMQLNAFISMIYNAIDKSMTIKQDALIMRTINNFTAETLHAEFEDGNYEGNSGVRAVNLLHLYNSQFPEANLTAEAALTNPEFNRFAAWQMGMYTDRLSMANTLFNIEGKVRHTSQEDLHVVMLSNFARAADAYLQSDTFHNEFTRFPKAEKVPYWQGPGVDYSFANASEINVTTSSGDVVEASGILCIMFDRDALGVSNLDRRTTSNYNPKAEFYTNFAKMDCGLWNDFQEQFVVFFIA